MITNIVLLSHNRPKLMAQTLNTLVRNTHPDAYTLTIVDDGSDLNCLVQAMTSFDAVPKHMTIITVDHCGIVGRVRNLGIYWSEQTFGKGDYLYLSDNDAYFTPGWLDTLIAAIDDDRCRPVVKLLGGWNHPYMQPIPDDVKGGGTAYLGDRRVKAHDAVAGASMLMRWGIYDKHGPFDATAAGVGQSEDWAFCQKIIQDGGKVASIYPRVVYNCGVTNSLGQLSPGADLMVDELKKAKLQF